MSTNKVYGDVPNELPLKELERAGTTPTSPTTTACARTCGIDRCLHSVFGASKVAADVMSPGVRQILRHQDRHVPRRLPDRPEPQRRRAARVPQLPVQGRQGRRALHDLRLQGQTGPRQHPQLRRHQRLRNLREKSPPRRSLQPRRLPTERAACSKPSRRRRSDRARRCRRATKTRTARAITSATSRT